MLQRRVKVVVAAADVCVEVVVQPCQALLPEAFAPPVVPQCPEFPEQSVLSQSAY